MQFHSSALEVLHQPSFFDKLLSDWITENLQPTLVVEELEEFAFHVVAGFGEILDRALRPGGEDVHACRDDDGQADDQGYAHQGNQARVLSLHFYLSAYHPQTLFQIGLILQQHFAFGNSLNTIGRQAQPIAANSSICFKMHTFAEIQHL